METARREILAMQRSQKPLSICYLDLDFFKQVNDRFGHEAGNELLQSVVGLIQKNLRPADLLSRVGGDEFAVLLPDRSAEQAKGIMERVQGQLLEVVEQRGWPVSVSIGVVSCLTPPPSLEQLLQKADEAMYHVKRHGRNGIFHVDQGAAVPKGECAKS